MFGFFLGYLLGRSADGEITLPMPTARTLFMLGVFLLPITALAYWCAYQTTDADCGVGLHRTLCRDDFFAYAHLGAGAFIGCIVIGLAVHRLTKQ